MRLSRNRDPWGSVALRAGARCQKCGVDDYAQPGRNTANLNEAVETLTDAEALPDAARPLYYLALIHSYAGDSETSLAMAYRSLHVTHPTEHVRLAQLYWLASVQLYRTGFKQYAMTLAKQALDESFCRRTQVSLRP